MHPHIFSQSGWHCRGYELKRPTLASWAALNSLAKIDCLPVIITTIYNSSNKILALLTPKWQLELLEEILFIWLITLFKLSKGTNYCNQIGNFEINLKDCPIYLSLNIKLSGKGFLTQTQNAVIQIGHSQYSASKNCKVTDWKRLNL